MEERKEQCGMVPTVLSVIKEEEALLMGGVLKFLEQRD